MDNASCYVTIMTEKIISEEQSIIVDGKFIQFTFLNTNEIFSKKLTIECPINITDHPNQSPRAPPI